MQATNKHLIKEQPDHVFVFLQSVLALAASAFHFLHAPFAQPKNSLQQLNICFIRTYAPNRHIRNNVEPQQAQKLEAYQRTHIVKY